MFHVGYGIANRELAIRKIAQKDHVTALILAAVHFEWMIKRTIIKLGRSPTSSLRKKLEGVYKIESKNGSVGYKEVWNEEVAKRFHNASLGIVLGRLQAIQDNALKLRGQVVHGNGVVSNNKAQQAIDLFLDAGQKLNTFASSHGENLDARLRSRINNRI
jgi:hypothetical protein